MKILQIVPDLSSYLLASVVVGVVTVVVGVAKLLAFFCFFAGYFLLKRFWVAFQGTTFAFFAPVIIINT